MKYAAFLGLMLGFTAAAQIRVEVSFPASVHPNPLTGRVFVVFASGGSPSAVPRVGGAPSWGFDVSNLKPGAAAVLGDRANGFPLATLQELPTGDYSVQAMICPYTEFHRADGHTMWAHKDQWEGQSPAYSPGNIYSDAQVIHFTRGLPLAVRLDATHVIPAVTIPPDTALVKHVKIRSALLTKFWGQPMDIGAIVLLPRDYEAHREMRYPVIYHQFHFGLGAPYGYSERSPETGFSRDWNADDFPRAFIVTFQHPTTYYDDSYAVNSANNGPYGDALTQELIPYLESHFRMIPEARGRLLTGGSTGGWEALALQVFYPGVFGGTWVFCPDSIDFSRYGILDIYNDENAYWVRPGSTFASNERPMLRTPEGQVTRTFREQSLFEELLGTRGRSGEQLAGWESVYGPVGDDGFPKPLWDRTTGKIDHAVAQYMRDHGYDLARHLESHWTELGPKLKGKLHFYVGDMDNWYSDLAVYRMESLLKKLNSDATFTYGQRQGHMWYPMTSSELVKMMVSNSGR